MALITITADNRHFADTQGNPFFAFGVSYSGYFDRSWKMWENDLFNPDLIILDFKKSQNSGLNSIRLFVHPALSRDIENNNFSKLDQVLSIAQDHKLKVLLTLNDSHILNLERVSQIDAKIAERYKDISTIMAYDLENEPVFYNLVAAVYPQGQTPPVQTGQLVDHYGQRVSRQEALEMQRNRRIPGHLDPDQAFYYINALRLFLEYDAAVNSFINQGKGTIVDFMLSAQAEPWYTFIEVFDGTIETWLRARIDPLRATGCQHLLTVGWNWMHFASLPANRRLNFQAYHNYTSLSLAGFNTNVSHLDALRRAFPDHPVIFEEFGWSNQSSSNPATSQPVSEDLTALYETAMHGYLRANAFGGAFKWKLNNVDPSDNPYEANFGVFKTGDQPKPIRDLMLRIGQDWLDVSRLASFSVVRDVQSGLSYRFDLPQHLAVGGHVYQDDTIGWQATGAAAHCFIKTINDELFIDSHGSGQISIEPWELIPNWNRARVTELYRIFSDNQQTKLHTYAAGEMIVFTVNAGIQYRMKMGAEEPSPPDDLPEIKPNPGEHVVVLGDATDYLPTALKYIRRFAPDFTFAAETVTGRWLYVTVIATPAQVSDALLDEYRGAGAILVERIVGDTPEATRSTLDDMANRGQRFLSAVTPPEGEPPTPTPEEPEPEPSPEEPPETYIVQPGDTLGKIAQKFYGQFILWPLIFEANRDKISNPSLIRVGMELLIPPRE